MLFPHHFKLYHLGKAIDKCTHIVSNQLHVCVTIILSDELRMKIWSDLQDVV